jgi:1-acyl-sn-glycerol-3-phosphate acyltransferase
MRFIYQFFLKITGWKIENNIPPGMTKCIVLAAPHTSNWDFYYAMAFLSILRINSRYTIKKEWMRFPFSLITKPLGGIAIDRSPGHAGEKRRSLIDVMVELFNQHKELVIIITPEGTRSKVEKWKAGFYHIAMKAKVPIVLGYIDYTKKTAGTGMVIYPTNYEKDMRTIMKFYRDIKGKHPEQFSIDTDFN